MLVMNFTMPGRRLAKHCCTARSGTHGSCPSQKPCSPKYSLPNYVVHGHADLNCGKDAKASCTLLKAWVWGFMLQADAWADPKEQRIAMTTLISVETPVHTNLF